MTAAYRYQRLLLQVLLHQKPCPQNGYVILHDQLNHLSDLGTLLKIYPDACFVQTHCAIEQAVAAWCNAAETQRLTRADSVDPHEVGRSVVAGHLAALTRGLTARKAADPARFIDVKFDELRADPKAVLKRVNERFGYPVPAAPNADSVFRTMPQPEKPHPLEYYGLTKEGLRRQFASYVAEFEL